MFGFGIAGAGQIWADDFQFDVVGSDVSTTQPILAFKAPFAEQNATPEQLGPLNLDFEN